MSESIIGRKRTACGTLFEVRVIGENADELTLYVELLLRTADIACRRMRAMRAELEKRTAELELGAATRALGGRR